MDACPMIARCHKHQWPELYGRPAVPEPVLSPEIAHELSRMIVDRGPLTADCWA